MTRTVECKRINEDGSIRIVNELECSRMARPPSEESCNEDEPCSAWQIVFGECSKHCGGGMLPLKNKILKPNMKLEIYCPSRYLMCLIR